MKISRIKMKTTVLLPQTVRWFSFRIERINRWHHSTTAIISVEAPLGDEILFLLFQNFYQHFVAILKAGNGIHNLMVSCVASGFVQLHGQFRQLFGMSSVVAYHIFHQCNQFIHRRVAVMVLVTMLMQMIVAVRMLMGVGMFVVMFMSVGVAVVGMLVRMCVGVLVVMFATGDMVVINVHGIISFTALHLLLLQTDWLLGSGWANGSFLLRGMLSRYFISADACRFVIQNSPHIWFLYVLTLNPGNVKLFLPMQRK